MRHYIFLTTLPYYKLYQQALIDQVTQDSHFLLTSSNYNQHRDTFNTSPFFSTHYVITAVISERDDEFLSFLVKASQHPWVTVLFCVGFMENYRTLLERLRMRKVQYEAVNCYKIPKAHKVLYIQREVARRSKGTLTPTKAICEMIIKRADGTEAKLDQYLEVLMSLGFDKRTIYATIKPNETLRLSELPMTLFMREKPDLCVTTLYRYRHSATHLRGTFDTFFETWEELYKQYRAGAFTQANYTNWVGDSGKQFKVYTEYAAQRWLKLFGMYSYGYMYNFKHELSQIKKYDWYSLVFKLYLMTGVMPRG